MFLSVACFSGSAYITVPNFVEIGQTFIWQFSDFQMAAVCHLGFLKL